MAMKTFTSNGSGDLNYAADSFGTQADTVFVLGQGFMVGDDAIRTYAASDSINLTQSSVNSSYDIFAGTGNDIIVGGKGNDTVYDGSGNDIVKLGAGFNRYFASAGNDIVIASANDTLSFRFLNNDGVGDVQENRTGVRFDLAATNPQNLGQFGSDTLIGFQKVEGSLGDDTLRGNNARNFLDGSEGNDILAGRGGNDLIWGDVGRDIVVGGRGADEIQVEDPVGFGGVLPVTQAFRDVVRYGSIADSGTAASSRDTIFGFQAGTHANADRIDLSRIDANLGRDGDQAFIFRGSGAFSSSRGEVQVQTVGQDTLVRVDIDADMAAEMTILVKGVTGLHAFDFLL